MTDHKTANSSQRLKL